MSNTTVPNLPAVTALYGTEQIYVVQNGVSSRATAQQIANLYQETLVVGVTPVNNAQNGYVLYNNNGILSSAPAGIGSVTNVTFTGGIVSVATSNTTPALTVAGTSGGVPYFSSSGTWASSSTLAANALVVGGGTGAAPITVTTGSGVLTALSNNTGSVGSVLVNGGTLGTPQNGVLTNATGLPLTTGVTGTLPVANGGTGITSLGTGVATALGQNVTGSGGIVLATNPTLTNPLNGTNGGTGVNNGSNTISVSGNVSHAGMYTQTFTATANTFLMLPTSGTLISSTTALSGAVTGTPSGSTYLRGDGTWSALPATALTINTTGINSGTSGRVLYDNAGTVGELAVTGSGSVVLSASPTLSGTSVIPTINSGTGVNLVFQSNGTTAATVDQNQNITTVGTVNMSSSFVRNRIINGAMAIDQRNNGASTTTAGYCVDRWGFGPSSGTATAQRVGSVGAYSLQITATTALVGLNVYQRIESNNIADLVGNIVTISFVASSSTVTSLPYGLAYATALDNFSSVTSITTGSLTINSTPTKYSFTATLPAGAANGIVLNIISGLNISSGNVTITNVQLEAGSIATPFERRQYGQELALCQRYYQYQNNFDLVGYCGGANVGASVSFITLMRVVPTITQINTFASATISSTPLTAWIQQNGFLNYHNGVSAGNFEYRDNWTASAEL